MDVFEGMDRVLDDQGPATFENLIERYATPLRSKKMVETRKRRIAAVARLLREARRMGGNRGRDMIIEAFSTSDFPLAFGWYTDLATLNAYAETPAVWDAFLKRSVLPDYRAAARDRIQGLDTPMNGVAELENYQTDAKLTGARDTSLQVKKYGRTFNLSFEASVNDVLKQLGDIPQRFARAARRTEQYQVASAYVANGTLYTSGQGNKGTGQLTPTQVRTALGFMMSQLDANGNPIEIGMVTLVVSPQLEITADALLGATNLIFDLNPSAGTQKWRYETKNFLMPRLNRVTDYYMPIIDASHGATSWYLFADPSVLQAGEVGFLQGHETPELFMRSPDAIRLSDGTGGGLANPLDGSFANDALAYKIRHNVGVTTYEPKATYWSDGTGAA